jgi:hypothetical protein
VRELLESLASHRRRIKAARAAAAAVKWTFYASVLACVCLAAQKIGGLTLPRSVAVTVLAAIPLGMAAREWARTFSVRDCAIHLDRVLGLDERLATAVEGGGSMSAAQQADASAALAGARLPVRRAPREARLLAGSALVLGALLLVPAPERSGAAADPALESAAAEFAIRLDELAKVAVEFREPAEILARGLTVVALQRFRELEEVLSQRLLDAPGGSAAETQKRLEIASRSAGALGAELAGRGIVIHSPPPLLAKVKLERRQQAPGPAPVAVESGADPEVFARAAVAALQRDWGPRHDPVVRRYFGGRP